MGWNLDSLICPPDLVTETRGLAEAVRQGETTHKITQRQLKNGLLVDVELFGIPVILGGKQIGALNLYHDISELVGVQQAMLTTRPVEAEWFSESEPPTDGSESLLVEEAANSLETTEVLYEKAGNGIVSESPSLVAEVTEPEAGVPEVADELKATFKQRAIPIEEIEGIGPVYAQKLSEADIKTTEDLLDAGKTRKGREELVKKLGVSGVLLLKWVNMADLMRVKGIGEEYSELLEKAGVDTVRELGTRRPDNLHAALIAANEEHKLVKRLPHLSEVESWVRLANDLEPLVTY